MKQKLVALMILLPLIVALVVVGCKKDESSPTAATTQPTFTFNLDGADYSGDAQATLRTSTSPHELRVWTKATPASGQSFKLIIGFRDTSFIKLNTPLDMTDHNVLWGHVQTTDDTIDVYCTATSYGSGTLTVTKWTGKEIAGTFVFQAYRFYTGRMCNVKNGSFKASSIQGIQ